MAHDHSAQALGDGGEVILSTALHATPGNATEYTAPAWAEWVKVYVKQSDDSTDDTGKIATSGTDGAAIGANYFPIPSGNGYRLRLRRDGYPANAVTFYVAAATASALCKTAYEVGDKPA